MAGNIPMGSMSTEIKLNGSQSVKTLRELKQAVTQATSAWKAQRAELSTIGKSTEAAEAKYKGLAETIKKQKDYISGLQEAQKHLQEAQKSVDRSTREGRQEYGKYNEALQKNETRIHSAEQKLASLTNQQTKAKSSLNYYKSGLAEAQKTLKTTTAVSRSYVERLESEGNHYKANEARISGYRSSINNLTKQYEIQSRELKRIAGEAGVTSEVYKHQQIRVNETATSLNKARLAVSGLEEEQRKVNPTPWDRLKAKISSVNKESQETHRTFREVFMGSALGNAISNAVSNLGSSLKSAYTEGMNLNLAIAKINGRFKGMGMNTRQIQALDKQIGELKSNTNLAGDSASNLQAHMLNWSTIGFKGAMQMSKALAGVGDSSKMTGQQIDQMSAGLQRIGSNGKVTYSSLSRITKAAPTFMATLARGAGMSESKLKALLKTGDVTQKQFQTWIAKSSKYADESFKGYGQSQAGALKAMTVARQKLEQEFTKPIFDAKTSGLQALKNIMTSKEVMAGANQLGKAVSNIIGYLDKHKGDIVAITKNVVSLGVEVGKAVWKDFAAIIQNIGKTLGIVKGNGKESSSALHTLATATADLAKNKTAVKAISDAIIAMIAIKGIGKISGGLFAIGRGAVTAYKSVKKLSSAIPDIFSNIKSIGSKALQAGKFLGSKITQGIKATTKFSMGQRLATGALAGAAVATPEVVNAIKDRHSANKRSQDIGGAVGALAGGTLTSMIPVVGPLLAPVGAIIGKYAGQWGGKAVNNFTKGWQKNKPPKKFWSLENLGWSTHDTFRKVGKWGSDVGKKFGQSLKKGKSFVKKNSKELALTAVNPLAGIPALLYKNNPKFRKWANGVAKNIKGGLNKAKKSITRFKNSVNKGFKKAWNSAYKHASKGTKQIMRSTEKFAKNYVKINKKANSETVKNFSSFGKRLKKNHGDLFKTIGQTAKKQLAIEKKRWSSNWKNIRSTAQGIWKGLNHNASDMYKKLNTATHGGLGKVLSGFKSFGKSIAGFWTDLWKNVTKTFSDTIKGLKDAANNVGKFFTGKLKVGSLHLAGGTDWRKRYGTPAIVNDAPGENYREGLLVNGQVIPFPDKRNLPFWLLPGQDVVNGNDMARIFGRSVRLANGTVNLRSLETNDPAKLLSTLTKLTKKKYDEDRQHHEKQRQRHNRNDNDRAVERERLIKQEHDAKSERAKIAKEIREALSKGRNTKGLTAQFNALTKHISNIKHSIAKTNPHHGQVYVDEGLLIGAKSRIGKSKWISDALFKKLTTKPKKRKTTHKRTSTRKHRTTRRRSYSSRSYSSVSVPKVRASNVSVGVSSKSVIVSAKVVGIKNVKALEKAMKRIKGGTRKITVKAKGSKSLKSLAKTVKKIKGKTSYIKVKTSGTHSLKSLSSHIASVHERVNSLNKSVKKTKFGTDIAKQAEKATKALKGEDNFAKVVNTMSKKSTKDFKDMAKSINKDTNKIRKSTESDFSNMYRKSYSSMNRLHSGVIRLAKSTASGFGNAMKKMVSYASDSMRGTIRQINRGIRGIDRVLKQFGGNSSVINPVHFAGGTDANGRLAHDTLAVVNDATTGPRQEAIVTDQNDVIIPHGDNRPMMLRKGWGVLNGTQTQSLGLPHFAKGTGVKKDALRKLAEHSLKHFADSFKSMFTKNIPSSGSDLTQGATDLGKNSGTHYGNPWSNAMWTVINNAIGTGGGTRAAFLRYAKETFDGVKYLMGAASKTLSDCSGMVMQALRHFGIDIGRTTVDMANSPGTKYLGKSLSKTEPGDLVIFGHGTGAAGHVGIINNPAKGTMFNETPPYARISKISDAMSMGYGYYRVKGLHDASKNHPKADPRLMALAKRELGHKALSWISDTLSENEGSMAGKPTGDHLHWMKQAHIPEKDWSSINWIVSSESGWNPHIVNPSSGTYGLGQMQSYNLHYYTRHGSKSNPIAQLMGIMDYIHDRYGSVANAVRFRKAHNWYANGGIANTPSIFGEAGPEMAIPLIPSKSTRAWELIGKAVGILSANSNFNNQQQVNSKEQKEEHDFRQAVLLLLTEIAGKSDVAKITLTTPAGRALWSIIQPFQKQDMKSEITRLRRGLSGGR
ncbi:tape measure protein [Lactobacillus amylovorus]|uniref:aggregation-promoting factor C-terminal-like domain-containing protein n=1 Tax=Lactobacillus amylovorus TaxID=1604 RepID=UPI003F9873C3